MKTHDFFRPALTALAVTVLWGAAYSYPLDGYEETGIRRVEGARLANEARAIGGFQPPGAELSTEQVDLRLLDRPNLVLPPADPEFTEQIRTLLGEKAAHYAVTVLDLSDPGNVRYAEFRGDYRQNVGSVGKLLSALGLFQALADTWPHDLKKRKEILRDTTITADSFSRHDNKNIRIFDVEKQILTYRIMQDGDRGSLWEFLDWMLSVSSNSAASMVMRDAMLMRKWRQGYPMSEEEIRRFFNETPAGELTGLFQATFWEPVSRNGLPLDQIRQGSFFTAQGKKNINGGGNSYATARTLTQAMLLMEQGKLVDEWSSRQLKRLLYLTERRDRYASSPELDDAAVYFKSGSLYMCREETGFDCESYRGNVINYMCSLAIIEQEIGGARLHYISAVISNVLRRDSSHDHQELGTGIHRLIKATRGLGPLE